MKRPAAVLETGAKRKAEGAEELSGDRAVQLLKEPRVDELAKVRVLKLLGAGLKGIPESTLRSCEQLTQLDIGGNPLEGLPAVAALPRLEILFASKVNLQTLPDLAGCPRLRMLGLKDNNLNSLDGNLLPECLEWLIAAGNSIKELPNIDRLKRVRKLMLSHNELTCKELAPVAGITALEMIRVAANRLEAFPEALLQHSRLAWIAVGGNPFAEEALGRHLAAGPENVDFNEVTLGAKLGSGAGATVYQGSFRDQDVAVKLWDSECFSDGTAHTEWAANRVASEPGHASLVSVLGTFETPRRGMILELLKNASAAAGGPTFTTVTRDALPCHGGPGPLYRVPAIRKIAIGVASAAAYLHQKGLMHGDIYLHNTLIVAEGPQDAATVCDVRLSDFGAAAAVDDPALRRMEVRSFGWLLQDLLESHVQPADEADIATVALLKDVRALCGHEVPEKLPEFAEIVSKLS
eukprot:TRINITY_DN35813_c0_g1_i1.p1 TRINITY_DN35813_c0_g1~~TRINITY_DN35813_c0_g1_i1.p1  ORF type:complete len:465 (+),score=118.40 TRINITY_DN35813_c0_g1_i1:33-1427(+)